MVDLPKIRTELTGDVTDLARAFAEANALRDAWVREMQTRMEAGGSQAGKKSSEALAQEFEKGLERLFSDSNRTGRVYGAFDRLGNDAGGHFGKSFFSSLPNLFKSSSWEGLHLTEAGKSLGVDFSRGWIKGIASIFDNPIAIGVGIPVVAAAISEGLAGIGGLGTAAVGLGGIAAGVIGQLRNPAIKAQAKQTGQDIYQSLTDSSTSFTAPLESALHRYDTFVSTSTGKFAQAYEPLAKAIVPLEMGFENFTNKIMPGLADLSNRAAPLIGALSRELPEVGKAVGDFFEKISASEKGNREGLIAIIDLIDMLIRFLGNLIEVGSHAFAGLVTASHAASIAMNDTIGAFLRLEGRIPFVGAPFKWLGDQVDNAAKQVDKLAHSGDEYVPHANVAITGVQRLTQNINAQSDAIDKLLGRYDKWFGVSMGVDQANLTLHQDITALTDSIAQNGRNWDLNTKAGQANYGALLQAIQGAKDFRDAQVAAGTSTAEANKTLQENIDKLLTQAGNAGLDAGTMQQLKNQVGGLIDSLNSLNGMHVTYYVNGIAANNNQFYQGNPANFFGGLEVGGAVPEARAAQGIAVAPRRPGTMVLMGEPGTRGEVAIPQAGISRQRAAALGAAALAPYGMAPAPAEGGSQGLSLRLSAPLYLNGRLVAEAIYEDLVSFGQERKNRKGSTGF